MYIYIYVHLIKAILFPQLYAYYISQQYMAK